MGKHASCSSGTCVREVVMKKVYTFLEGTQWPVGQKSGNGKRRKEDMHKPAISQQSMHRPVSTGSATAEEAARIESLHGPTLAGQARESREKIGLSNVQQEVVAPWHRNSKPRS